MKGDGELCHYCNEKMITPTRDHKFPKSEIKKRIRSGKPMPDGFTYQSNTVWACRVCNAMKASKDYDGFVSMGVKAIRHKKKIYMNNLIKKMKG